MPEVNPFTIDGRMFNKHSIVIKISCLFLVCSTLVLGFISTYNFFTTRKALINLALDKGQLLGRDVANGIAKELKPVEAIVQNMAVALENENITSQEMMTLLNRLIATNTTVFGMAIAFEPYKSMAERKYYSPYSFKGDEGIEQKVLGSESYDYFAMDWYQRPKELQQPYWTEPYYDTDGGNALMVTYSVPFYRTVGGKNQFYGVVTADIALDWLSQLMDQVRLYQHGYALLFSQSGTVIYHPQKQLIALGTIFSFAEQEKDEKLRDIGRAMTAGKEGITEHVSNHNDLDSYFLYMPLEVGNWSIGLVFPKEEILSDLKANTLNAIFLSISGFLLLVLTIIMLSRKITKPIIQLSQSTKEIAAGNLDAKLPDYRQQDEVGQLINSFRQMEMSLKQYIEELTETTASKEKIESELRIARDIQMGILPKLFPAFPDRTEFDIRATIEPAREVGGDLYDFFFLDEDHFCFLIGDVSGKGVPAAFFMAVTKTMLNIVAEQKRDTGKILSKVNDDLAKDNEACMFVTLFLAVLNIRTGEVQFSSAGHNPPIHLSSQDGKWLDVPKNPAAGVIEGLDYATCNMQLKSGDTLFLYTDGVTEAMNNESELYSDDKLIDLVRKSSNLKPEELLEKVGDSVTVFADGAEQADDITMLAIKFEG